MTTRLTSTSSLSLLVVVVIVAVAVALSLLHFNPRRSPATLTLDRHRRNYVVRFVEYRRWEDHRDYLKSGVPAPAAEEGWGWIERNNPAKDYRTDFGVVWIEDGVRELVIGEIGKLGRVKDVNASIFPNILDYTDCP